MSVGRRQPASRSATETSSRSPVRCPRLSLTVLKPSRSQNRTATGVSGPLGAGDRMAQAVEEQRSIGKPGERVVKRLVHRLLDGSGVVEREARVLGEGEQHLLVA